MLGHIFSFIQVKVSKVAHNILKYSVIVYITGSTILACLLCQCYIIAGRHEGGTMMGCGRSGQGEGGMWAGHKAES